MTRWGKGEAIIGRLLTDRSLEQVTGAAANGMPAISEARRRLQSAELLEHADPGGAFTLAYDAARLACTGLLAQQGLRPTSNGGHRVVEDVMRAQFGGGFSDFGWMRRRRNEIEYPTRHDNPVQDHEIKAALHGSRTMIDNAAALVSQLGFF